VWWLQAILSGFLPAVLGGFVGLVLGILRWPLVLALVGGSTTLAAGTNLAVSTVSAVGGTYKHAREGRVDTSLFIRLGGGAIVGGLVGSMLTRLLPTAVLLWLITTLLLFEGARMLRAAGVEPRVATPPTEPRWREKRRRALAELFIGFVIGVLSGMVGMLLGSLRLPAMIRWLGVDPRRAVGTNMAIGLVQGAAATVGHLWQAQVSLLLMVVVGAAAMLGSYVGAHFTGRLPVPTLKRAIAVVLLLMGALLARLAWQA
jgi:uncharacterized membrane protein YfcA